MHILFCTAAKHLFGIKMCTPVIFFFSLNITSLIYTAYLTCIPQRLRFNKVIKEAGNNSAFPFS